MAEPVETPLMGHVPPPTATQPKILSGKRILITAGRMHRAD